MKVSFVIPAHNEAAWIGRTLGAIRTAAEEAGVPHEMIVVDDASTDKVFRYAVTAATGAITLLNSWNLSASNTAPTGITLDPGSTSGDLWVLDNGTTKQVFQYTNGRAATGSTAPTGTVLFTLSGLSNPQGIADPPLGESLPVTPTQMSEVVEDFSPVSDSAPTPGAPSIQIDGTARADLIGRAHV